MALPDSRRPGVQQDAERIRGAVARFGAELAPRMHGDGRREDQLRAPVYSLLKAIGEIVGKSVVVHDEVTIAQLGSRPDFAVDAMSGRVGYVELKAPEKDLPGTWRPSKHDREQWEKLRTLPNLIYTNGSTWRLYRKGEAVGPAAKLLGDLTRAGDRLQPADDKLERLFREFLVWQPSRLSTLQAVVAEVAPLCRLLRYQVAETIEYERTAPGKSPFTTLAAEWRAILFPALTDVTFADAYAQAVTFALLLARVDGVSFDQRSMGDIVAQLSKQHSLMGEALSILANPRWASHLSVIETLRRVVGNIEWDDIDRGGSDTYGVLYETFLAEYDPQLRRQSGTYYTPDPVARAMVRFTDQILKTRLHKQRGFAADDVIVVDPAMGAGTFLVEIIDSVVATLQDERGPDATPEAHLRDLFANRLVGFELQAAPYAVAELRLHHTLKRRYGVELPRREVRFLSDALDDPDTLPIDFGQLYDVLKEMRESANQIKREQPVMVVIGNPPWKEHSKGAAPWLERPRDPRIQLFDLSQRPSIDEFRSPGQEHRAFNLSNMWTFFWRWSAWKVFDANPQEPAGVVALITPSAYATSPSYAGMRRYLRENADEGWIIDLSPEGFQPPTATRLFPTVQQPICIGIFARYGEPDRSTPARIHHTSVAGAQYEKFSHLGRLEPDGDEWRDTSSGWEASLRPDMPSWTSYPKLDDLLPSQFSGVTSNRNWVWAPEPEILRSRWATLVHSSRDEKQRLFKETDDRKVDRAYPSLSGIPSGTTLAEDDGATEPNITPVAFRSFDRQYLIYDRRVIDRPRPELWQARSEVQIYGCEPPAYPLATGPGITFSSLVPNVDHFMGHHGGRILPLYRGHDASAPNVAPGFLDVLTRLFGSTSAEDLLAYIGGIASHSGYTRRFSEQLIAPGLHIPLTADARLWRETVEIGREVLWLHTYGERCTDESANRTQIRPRLPRDRQPRVVKSISASEFGMPDRIDYDSLTETLLIGGDERGQEAGRIERVTIPMWEYTVGDMPVIRSWFDYRQTNPRHKKRTSRLDDINSTAWTYRFDDDLIDLLNVIGRCIDLEPRQRELLTQICTSEMVTVDDLVCLGVFPIPAAVRRVTRKKSDAPQLGDTV